MTSSLLSAFGPLSLYHSVISVDNTTVACSREVEVVIVTSTDRFKSVQYSSVFEHFGGVFVLSLFKKNSIGI